MDQLIDTCALLFFLEDDPRLPQRACEAIEDPGRRSLVSLASLWEMAIKASLGKLQADYARRPDLPDLLRANGFEVVAPGWEAMRTAALLPPGHRDPFDRLLVAEARLRKIPVITPDESFDAYHVARIWR